MVGTKFVFETTKWITTTMPNFIRLREPVWIIWMKIATESEGYEIRKIDETPGLVVFSGISHADKLDTFVDEISTKSEVYTKKFDGTANIWRMNGKLTKGMVSSFIQKFWKLANVLLLLLGLGELIRNFCSDEDDELNFNIDAKFYPTSWTGIVKCKQLIDYWFNRFHLQYGKLIFFLKLG